MLGVGSGLSSVRAVRNQGQLAVSSNLCLPLQNYLVSNVSLPNASLRFPRFAWGQIIEGTQHHGQGTKAFEDLTGLSPGSTNDWPLTLVATTVK